MSSQVETLDWSLLDYSDEAVIRQGVEIPAWFDMQVSAPSWPTEAVLSVVVDADQGPIINGIRGGRSCFRGYQDIAKMVREAINMDFLLRYMTAQAAGTRATRKLLQPHEGSLEPTAETVSALGDLREGLAQRSFYATRSNKRRRVTRELLREVADVYRKAHEAGTPPTAAVAGHFHVSHSTAGRWVVETRRAGELGPAAGTKAGEAGQADGATPST